MQALLFRARRLGRLGEVSYRNAMTTISVRGWRRDEPGLVETIEQPSLLPKALELLAQEGIEEALIIAQCRLPVELFRTVTSRTPEELIPGPRVSVALPRGSGGRVVSLLKRPETAPVVKQQKATT